MGMSEFYGARDDQESIATIHRAVALGVTLLDTADMYGCGENERLVGRAIKGHRREVILATKFGNVRDERGNFLGVNGAPEYVRQCCDASLRRLGVDEIDLYYQHRVDPKVPIEETVGAMSELVRAGKVHYLGLSEAAPATIRQRDESASHQRVADGVFPVDARCGGGNSAGLPGTGDRLRGLQPVGSRAFSRRNSRKPTTCRRGIGAGTRRASKGENFERNLRIG